MLAHEQFGLILIGSCPGGSASNFWTAMFNGDVNLSVTMTLVSSVASFGMTSFWAWFLGSNLVEDNATNDPTKSIHIPYSNLMLSLLGFAVPLFLGALFRYKWESIGTRIHTLASKPVFLVSLILLFVLGILNSMFMFYLLNWRHILAGFLMGSLGYIFGATMAFVFCQSKPQIIAISIETALQNFGIAFVALNLTFESPYSDLAVLPIIGYYICATTPTLLTIYLIYLLYPICKGQKTFNKTRRDSATDFRNSLKL